MKVKKTLRDLKIRTKLMAAFVFVAVIVFVVSLITAVELTDTRDKNNLIYEKVLLSLDYLVQSSNTIERMKIEGRDALLNKDAGQRGIMAQNITNDAEKVKKLMIDYEDTILTAECQEAYDILMVNLDKYIDLMVDFTDLLKHEGQVDDATKYLESELSPISGECLKNLETLLSLKLGIGEDTLNISMGNSWTAFKLLMVIAVIGLAASIIFGIYFSISVSKPMIQGAEIMKKAVEGDFTVRCPEHYGAEIGELFDACNLLNKFNSASVTNLQEVIGQIRELSQNMLSISSYMASNSKGLKEQTSVVSTATEEFSAGMTQSANSLSTASAHIAAVASSIEEINSTISTVAAAAEQTSARVEQSSTLVDSIQGSIANASNSVNLVSNAFNKVAGSVDEINKSISVVSEHSKMAMTRMADADQRAKNTNMIIQRLETASKQIGKIVGVISDIADQTNMLALNAAIEAAGAGEAGKGFMVVANEVKELAKQTADATDEIADQIENMQGNMPEAVGAVSEITSIINGMTEFMNSFATEITQQGKRSDQIAEESAAAARRMTEITDEINRISENALSVTKTVVESTKGVNEIAKSTAELVIGSQEIAMNSERASNNISEINRASKEMVSGLVEISKNIQLIDVEASDMQLIADSTKLSSGELFKLAVYIEQVIAKFKTSANIRT